jgi:Bacterial protein of unknown function (DUF899)
MNDRQDRHPGTACGGRSGHFSGRIGQAKGSGEGAHPGRRRDRSGPAAPIHGRGRRQPRADRAHGSFTLLEAFEGRRQLIACYFMWHPGRPAAEQCEGCTWVTTQVTELSYLNSRDMTYAVFCQGPYDESVRYHDFMGWDMPWYSALPSFDALLVGRQIGLFHLVCNIRDGGRVFVAEEPQISRSAAIRRHEALDVAVRSW